MTNVQQPKRAIDRAFQRVRDAHGCWFPTFQNGGAA